MANTIASIENLMRIINTFADFHPLEHYYPVCSHCGHEGFPFDTKPSQSVISVKSRFKCTKCHSKRVMLMVTFRVNKLRMRSIVWFSDDLSGPIPFNTLNPTPFKGYIT